MEFKNIEIPYLCTEFNLVLLFWINYCDWYLNNRKFGKRNSLFLSHNHVYHVPVLNFWPYNI